MMGSFPSTISETFGLVSAESGKDNTSNMGARLLLTGPNSCGKTSLLFEYAISCAERGETVLFIAPKSISRLPLFVNGRSQPKSEVLKLINLVYLPNYKELIDFFSRVHLSEVSRSSYGRPKRVLIDDFGSYFQEKCSRTEETTCIAKCLAYIIDAVEYFSKMEMDGDVNTNCHLVIAEMVSSDSGAIDGQVLYEHWIRDFLTIRPVGSHMFEIKHVGCQAGATWPANLVVQYQICEKGIEIKDVEC